jgi:hypothetical protein
MEAARYESRFAVGFIDSRENVSRKRKFIIYDDTKINTTGDLRQLMNINGVRARNKCLGVRY